MIHKPFVIFQVKMPNTTKVQLLSCDDLRDNKPNISGVEQNRQFHDVTLGFWEIVMGIFHYVLTFYRSNNEE